MLTLITHTIALLLGGGGGWYLKGRFGTKVGEIVTDIKKP